MDFDLLVHVRDMPSYACERRMDREKICMVHNFEHIRPGIFFVRGRGCIYRASYGLYYRMNAAVDSEKSFFPEEKHIIIMKTNYIR